MQVYIVGGAVRDELLNRPYTDKDFVVVGVTPEQMIEAGFIQVGADFPVFLHPKTKEEYALARTERKSGKGYKGFEVYASPEVTIEQDLLRRDLTINAMAIEVKSLMDDTILTGEVIDPYGGREDIKTKTLRHVSEAFSEDPLRVLRIARFYGRFYDPKADHNFSIAPDTLALIATINDSDELACLTAERVWQETSRALMQECPYAYLDCLQYMGALPHIFPSIANALGDDKIKALVFQALQLAGQLNLSLQQRWAIIMLSFAQEVIEVLNPRHHSNHHPHQIDEALFSAWASKLKQVSHNLKVPKKTTQFAASYANCSGYLAAYPYLGQHSDSDANSLTKLIVLTKADKDPSELHELIQLHKVIEMAWQQLEMTDFIKAYTQISMADIDPDLQGSAIGTALSAARINAIAQIL